jgi:hypothetical protein
LVSEHLLRASRIAWIPREDKMHRHEWSLRFPGNVLGRWLA